MCDFAPTSKKSKKLKIDSNVSFKDRKKSYISRNISEEAKKMITPINFANHTLVSLQDRLASELNISFGQSPAVSKAMAETVDKIYSEDNTLTKPGQILYCVTCSDEPSGKPLIKCKKISVKLNLWLKSDDNIVNQKDRKKAILKRISHEAYEQKGVLTIQDCSRIMITSERTIKEYISEFKKKNISLPLRGYIHNTGRGQTHKSEIIEDYLKGLQLHEIEQKRMHSISAISRYLLMFQKIIICYKFQKINLTEIATITGQSLSLVKEYLEIYKKYSLSNNSRLELLLNPKDYDDFIMPYKKKSMVI
jgi:hypothetical protein